MSKMIFVSNRLPVSLSQEGDKLAYQMSIGGLATGLKSYHDSSDSTWIGWCGFSTEDLEGHDKGLIEKTLAEKYSSIPVFMTEQEIENFYLGFCNRTIWPLFHYFTDKAEYVQELWDCYRDINRKFLEKIDTVIEEDDTVWIHDYQLMLLPKMIKEKYPRARVGFFLHIPFPSYEVFRNLPWKKEILNGLLGSDLIGFHTYDYVRHFTSSVRRLLHFEHNLGEFNVDDRLVKVDVFPMGIDYKKYAETANRKKIQKEIESIRETTKGQKIVLSVDRLDYTKGIVERIRSYNFFLEKNPEYIGKVTMILILAPSRTDVEDYIDLRRKIEEMVSHTNGIHGQLGWVPIWFYYRSFNFDELTSLYSIADVLLITPLRDGMNLVSKEYIATRTDKKGVLILSETAGSANEMSEALVVNPNDTVDVAENLKTALEMPVDEQQERNGLLHKRLKRYDIMFWADDFLGSLNGICRKQSRNRKVFVNKAIKTDMLSSFRKAATKLILLDYDGTLTEFRSTPEKAKPDKALMSLLGSLRDLDGTTLVLTSGRDKDTIDRWFSPLKIPLTAGHGMWSKNGGDWEMAEQVNIDWKEQIAPVLDFYTARTPGSFIEDKSHSMSWHYRKCDPDLADIRLSEIKDALRVLTENLNIGIIDGNKVIEVKNTNINKGTGASPWLTNRQWDFILAVGDDWTDEDMFKILPSEAYSVKVGNQSSAARYHIPSVKEVRNLLKDFAGIK